MKESVRRAASEAQRFSAARWVSRRLSPPFAPSGDAARGRALLGGARFRRHVRSDAHGESRALDGAVAQP